MKLEQIKAAARKAEEAYDDAATRVLETQLKLKLAKEAARQLKAEHKRARKAAKEAKRLALQAEEQLEDDGRALARTNKRLAKALRKQARRTRKKGPAIHARALPSKPAKTVRQSQRRAGWLRKEGVPVKGAAPASPASRAQDSSPPTLQARSH